MLPFECELTEDGECIAFNSKQLVLIVTKTCQLEEVGKLRPFVFAVTCDWAKITNELHQMVTGLKVADIAAIDPLTKILTKLQTRNVCWPVRIVLGKET